MDFPWMYVEQNEGALTLAYDLYEERFVFPVIVEGGSAGPLLWDFVEAFPWQHGDLKPGLTQWLPCGAEAKLVLSDDAIIHDEALAEEARRVARAFLVMEEL